MFGDQAPQENAGRLFVQGHCCSELPARGEGERYPDRHMGSCGVVVPAVWPRCVIVAVPVAIPAVWPQCVIVTVPVAMPVVWPWCAIMVVPVAMPTVWRGVRSQPARSGQCPVRSSKVGELGGQGSSVRFLEEPVLGGS